ncbi:MAG TPA: hypothetical protein VFF57_06740 [Hanamia sp.]|nr:hypothetical protein [Hanamia sp.]
MKLEEYRKSSREFSKSASDIIRQLALAGIAIIWVFKIEKPTDHLIPGELFKPLLFIVITLCIDFLQYFIPSIIWIIFYRRHEAKGTDPELDLKANKWLSLPGYICYFTKVLFLIISYVYIIDYILHRI